MSNYPPGWHEHLSEHHSDCQSLCPIAEWSTDNRDDDELPCGHTDHDCNCADLVEAAAEREAASWLDMDHLWDLT